MDADSQRRLIQFRLTCIHNWREAATHRECTICLAREILVNGQWVSNPDNQQEEAA